MNNERHLTFLEKAIISISTLIAVLALYFLFNENYLRDFLGLNSKGEVKVGEILSSKLNTKRRLQSSPIWLDLSSGDTVYNNDALYTGADSQLEVFLIRDQVKINILPNSLIYINNDSSSIDLDIVVGSVQAKIKKDQVLNLYHDGKLTRIKAKKNTKIKAEKIKDKVIQLKAISGLANILEKNKNIQFKKDELFEYSNDKYKKIENLVILSEPNDSENIWKNKNKNKNKKIKFSWLAKEQEKNLFFEISKNKNFNKIIINKAVEDKSNELISMSNLNGTYYWRVRSDKGVSATRSFIVTDFDYLQTIYPVQDLRLTVKQFPLSFRWETIEQSSNYQLQISKNKEFRTKIIDRKYKEGSSEEILLDEGIYFWRVRVVDIPELSKIWSPVSTFIVGSDVQLPEVLPITEKEQTVIEVPNQVKTELPEITFDKIEMDSLKSIKADTKNYLSYKKKENESGIEKKYFILKNPPHISWGKSQTAENYLIQFSKSEDFKKVVYEKNLNTNVFKWNQAKLGTYYFRVFPLNEQNERGPSSVPKKMINQLLPLKINEMENIKKVFNTVKEYESSKLSFDLSWNEIPYAKGYELEISSPSGISLQVLQSNFKEMEVSQSGNYKFRVRPIGLKNKPLTQFSLVEKMSVNKVLNLKKPRPFSPAINSSVILFDTSSVEPVIFDWSKVSDAENYELEIAKDSNFSSIVFQKEIKTDNFVLESPQMGENYWRVRAKYKNFTSEWSKVFKYKLEKN